MPPQDQTPPAPAAPGPDSSGGAIPVNISTPDTAAPAAAVPVIDNAATGVDPMAMPASHDASPAPGGLGAPAASEPGGFGSSSFGAAPNNDPMPPSPAPFSAPADSGMASPVSDGPV